MSIKLPPVPHNVQVVDLNTGFFAQAWADWLLRIYLRLGGANASSNTELDSAIAILKTELVPSGAIISFSGASAPIGYLMCDGSAVSRTTYASLFSAIGTAHGSGDGTTTFNIPDYRGRFLRGHDAGAGRDPNAASRSAMSSGGSTGDSVGSIQSAATALPTTPMTADSQGSHAQHWTGTIAAVQSGAGINALTAPAGPNTLGAHTHSITGGGDSETRPINASVNYLVKT